MTFIVAAISYFSKFVEFDSPSVVSSDNFISFQVPSKQNLLFSMSMENFSFHRIGAYQPSHLAIFKVEVIANYYECSDVNKSKAPILTE